MRRAGVAIPLVLLLAGCGTATATNPTGSGVGTTLSAAPAQCTPAPTTCTVEVTYANAGTSPITIDAGLTQLVDKQGVVHRALASTPTTSGISVAAGA